MFFLNNNINHSWFYPRQSPWIFEKLSHNITTKYKLTFYPIISPWITIFYFSDISPTIETTFSHAVPWRPHRWSQSWPRRHGLPEPPGGFHSHGGYPNSWMISKGTSIYKWMITRGSMKSMNWKPPAVYVGRGPSIDFWWFSSNVWWHQRLSHSISYSISPTWIVDKPIKWSH